MMKVAVAPYATFRAADLSNAPVTILTDINAGVDWCDRVAGSCGICTAGPLKVVGFSELVAEGGSGSLHELTISTEGSMPSKENPGLRIHVACLTPGGEAQDLMDALAKDARPTNSCPHQISVIVSPDVPTPILLNMLSTAGASFMRLLRDTSPYILTSSSMVEPSARDSQGGLFVLELPLKISGSQDVQAPKSPLIGDWGENEDEAFGSAEERGSESPPDEPAVEQSIEQAPVAQPEQQRQRLVLTAVEQSTEQAPVAQPEQQHQRLVVLAMSWDMVHYSADAFKAFYGEEAGKTFFQAAIQATMDTKATVRKLIHANRQALANYWGLLSGWARTAPTVQEAKELMDVSFYVPLRWRYEYLQSVGIPMSEWKAYDLSSKEDRKATWEHVKKSARQFSQAERRNTLGHVINKTCKCTNLCKLVINFGVKDQGTVCFILESLVARKKQDGNERVALNITDAISVRGRLTLRSRSPTPRHAALVPRAAAQLWNDRT